MDTSTVDISRTVFFKTFLVAVENLTEELRNTLIGTLQEKLGGTFIFNNPEIFYETLDENFDLYQIPLNHHYHVYIGLRKCYNGAYVLTTSTNIPQGGAVYDYATLMALIESGKEAKE